MSTTSISVYIIPIRMVSVISKCLKHSTLMACQVEKIFAWAKEILDWLLEFIIEVDSIGCIEHLHTALKTDQFNAIKPYLPEKFDQSHVDNIADKIKCYRMKDDTLSMYESILDLMESKNLPIELVLLQIDTFKAKLLKAEGRATEGYTMLKVVGYLLETLDDWKQDDSEITIYRRIATIFDFIFRDTRVKLAELGELNIIDLTDNTVYDLFKQSLKPEFFEKLKLPISMQWEEEPYCKKLLNALCEPHADQRDLCQILRTPVTKPEDYRPAKHYDLRAVENIVGTWIDLMCSPSNSIVTERGERTSAIDGVILVTKNLSRPFNDIVHTRWIEIEEGSTTRHKWDGVVSVLDGKAIVMLIEFAGGFVNVDQNKLENDTIKIYRNATRLLNSKNSSPENPPSIFETLTLVTDRAYVRTRAATLDVPYSPNSLKTAMEQLPTVFTWRDMVIASVKNTVTFDNSNLETIPVPSTP